MSADLSIDLKGMGIVRKFKKFSNILNVREALTLVGMDLLNEIHENFEVGGGRSGFGAKWKKLSPNTLANRTGSTPLKRSGDLKRTYNFDVSGNHVDVGSNSKIAAIHNDGTDPYTIRPKNKKLLSFKVAAGGQVFAKEVNHPGLPKRQQLPSITGARRISRKAMNVYIKTKLRKAGL